MTARHSERHGWWAARLGFFAFAAVGSPLVVWIIREWIYELDGATGWIYVLGLPALLTILVGAIMRRVVWELLQGATLSAGLAWLSLIVTLLVACSGVSDCL